LATIGEEINSNKSSGDFIRNVNSYLLTYGYEQIKLSQFSSLFCATIILIGLYNHSNNDILLLWYSAFAVIVVGRLILSSLFKRQEKIREDYTTWRNLFFLGAVLGGLSWGALGAFLFPLVEADYKVLCILILAGVTAGSAVSLAAMYRTSACFLMTAILPFVVQIIFSKLFIYSLYNITLIIYLFFLLILSYKTYLLIKNILLLQFKNQDLLEQLSVVNLELKQIATHDPLTQLDNVFLFNLNLTSAINRADRTNKMLALLYIDLDSFKNVNDSFGHNIGDKLLQTLAKQLRATLRITDIIARIGGDEFAVILEQMPSRESIIEVAQNICAVFSKPITVDNYIIKISASIGISIYKVNGNTKETLIEAADKAMYYVKQHGHNNYHFSS